MSNDLLKILIIDDDASTAMAMRKLLEKEGFTVHEVRSGTEALAKLREDHGIQVVITDVRMPGMDGLTILKNVKEMRPEVEVIMVTAYGDYNMAIEALRNSAFDYLKKPIDIDDLLGALGRYLERRALRQNYFPNFRVLLLDDEETQRTFLKRLIEDEGFEVLVAGNGEEGIKIFEREKIDIIVTDIKMPGMSGMEVLYKVKKMTSDIEVILVTGHGDQNVAIEALRGGACDYLKKPIDLDELIFALQKAKERVKLERSLRYRNRDLRLMKEMNQ